jgi:hypothetical protein
VRIRSTLFSTLLLAGVLAAGLPGCGDDRIERGLAPKSEDAVPFDPKQAAMPDAEREKQVERQLDQAEERKFEDAEEPAEEAEQGRQAEPGPGLAPPPQD